MMPADPPTGRLSRWTPGLTFRGTLVVMAVALGFWVVFVARDALFSLFVAIVISTAISPAVDMLERRGIARGAGVILVYAGIGALVVTAALLIVPLAADQGARITQTLGAAYESLSEALRASPSRVVRRLAQQLPPAISVAPPAGGAAGEALGSVPQLLAMLRQAGDAVFVFAAVLLLTFYWTLERERLVRSLLRLLAPQRREPARELLAASEARVGGYIRGVAILCLVVGVMAFIAYSLIGLPNALILALAAGLFEAVPIVGPALGAVPAIVVALGIGPEAAGWVIAATVVIQLVENAVLVPRVMRHAVGVNPIVTLISLAAFGQLFGLAGALLAIPLAAVFQLLLNRLLVAGRDSAASAPAGRDRISVLRYEAQELAADARRRQREKPSKLADSDDHVEEKLEALAAELDGLLARTQRERQA